MNTLQQILPLYLGQKVVGTYSDASGSIGYLTGVTNGGAECEIQFILEDGINVEEEPTWNESKDVKLILRPLSSMTEEEANYIMDNYYFHSIDHSMDVVKFAINVANRLCQQMDVALYLLSKGFDIFGLKEKGLCIYETDLSNG